MAFVPQLQDRQIGNGVTLQSAAVATGVGVALDMYGHSALSVCVNHVGSATATVTFQGSVDGGTTWFSLGLTSLTDSTTIAATDASAGSAKTTGWALPASRRIPLTNFRANITSWTAGTITVVAFRKEVGSPL